MKTRTMVHAPKSFIVFTICMFLFSFNSAFAGNLTVNPGPPQTICKGDSATLGGTPTATGGTAPYNYTWQPSAGMNSNTLANPTVQINATTMFYVTVTDAAGGRAIDSVLISVSDVSSAGAGNDTAICPLTAGATLGNSNNTDPSFVYTWTPLNSGLSCYNCAHPIATPTVTTTYSLLVSNGKCMDTTKVVVTVLASPTITVTSPVTFNEGSQATLNASGASKYLWTPDTNIFNQNTATPTVSPNTTTTYTVIGIGADGCPNYNTVVVDVIPDSNLTFYNTFTPNGDGINDTWFIGNLDLYPNNTLTIFNRYGKVVYFAEPYYNLWAGTSQGSDLPDATYYYILSTGTGTTYKGAVTIIRKKH